MADSIMTNLETLQAMCVANDYAGKHFSDFMRKFEKDKLSVFVTDKGEAIEVAFQVPEGMLGGGPAVIIDKKTMKVIKSFQYQ
jgi:hypothetical protein